MNFRKQKIPMLDLTKKRLSPTSAKKFRGFWKFYCKDISPKSAEGFLKQAYPEYELWDIKRMYKEWRKEYLESEEW